MMVQGIDFGVVRAEFDLPGAFSAAAQAEAENAVDRFGAGRVDETGIAFVTIDPPGSMDLDQAVHIEKTSTGYVVHYAIADVAAGLHIDAIAMSTHGRGMSRLFLGSVADKVLRASDVPLLLQRPVQAGRHAPLIEDEGVRAQLPALSGL